MKKPKITVWGFFVVAVYLEFDLFEEIAKSIFVCFFPSFFIHNCCSLIWKHHLDVAVGHRTKNKIQFNNKNKTKTWNSNRIKYTHTHTCQNEDDRKRERKCKHNEKRWMETSKRWISDMEAKLPKDLAFLLLLLLPSCSHCKVVTTEWRCYEFNSP